LGICVQSIVRPKYENSIVRPKYENSIVRPKYENSIARPKYENSITHSIKKKEEFLKKTSVAGSKKNCWLSQIKQARKGFPCSLPISSLSKTIAAIIVGIIIGITFYI